MDLGDRQKSFDLWEAFSCKKILVENEIGLADSIRLPP